ncbi:dihydrofolate reductase family protein [Pseudarthrobacter sp. NIBRBAC000502771]|uniref:dihydrofolate reductase family protein n=1 Tax=Pseudarthrobacter sp. NIBRBAC000502771 TaxID=2590774 RepID=UPI001132681F|nr:dihydrofolate reductase family protein [Pseudarthrobacter sp. NIBRBAC000502771]QDG62708.1 deaminase [Pseudarthrobacter sp. NIBRBAC000502771]
MAKLIYSAIMSLDGYTADTDGNFNWSMPDEEIHAFVNDLERDVGTYLLGRRMYEVMSNWETMDTRDEPPVIQDYARIWQGADKVVYSTTLDTPSTPKTRLERQFLPETVRDLKSGSDHDISIGGPTLAAHALKAGLVDECRLFINPVAVGGGLRFLPDGLKAQLELVDQRRFGNGVVYLRYRAR